MEDFSIYKLEKDAYKIKAFDSEFYDVTNFMFKFQKQFF